MVHFFCKTSYFHLLMYPRHPPTLTVQAKQNKRPKSLDAVKQKCVLAVNTVGRRLCKQVELVLRRTDCGWPFPVWIPFTATAAPLLTCRHSCGHCWRRNINRSTSQSRTPRTTPAWQFFQIKCRQKATANFFESANVRVEVAGNICLDVAGSAPALSLNHPELPV